MYNFLRKYRVIIVGLLRSLASIIESMWDGSRPDRKKKRDRRSKEATRESDKKFDDISRDDLIDDINDKYR